jgi:tetratricopeptide (TPR) repeat protein
LGLRALGAPLGEPFADDFHFLHHAMFGGAMHWLDGGGAVIYWRPLARQAYYDLLGPLMLTHPRALATLHGVLLAIAALLIYRALRPHWAGWAAAAAASFPLIAEASRTLLLWPSAFQDLGALLFSALALHEASRRRLPTTLASLAAALLCKEIAVVAALLVPWMPGARDRRERWRWAIATTALVLVWGAVYVAAMRHAGLTFQRHFEAARPPLSLRMVWALFATLLDALSLGGIRKALGLGMALVAGTLAVLAPLAALRSHETRARLRRALPWVAWGSAWFLLSTATLSEVFPLWGPFRSAFGMLGFGIALCAWLSAAGPAWLGVLAGLRIAALLLSTGPPRDISAAPYDQGAAMDFESLVRLSRLTVQTRAVLAREHPTLPPHAVVVWHQRPLMADHAFASGKALQVWYRDTTLRVVPWEEVLADPARRLDVALEYQSHEARQVVAIAPEAMATYRRSLVWMDAGDYPRAIAGFAAADSQQHDRGAKAFLSTLAGKRAISAMAQGDVPAARRNAQQSLALWHEAGDARYVIAVLLAAEHRYAESRAQLDTLLSAYPFDASARAFRDSVVAHDPGR